MSWRFVSLPPQDGYHMVTSFVSVAEYVTRGGKNTFLVFSVKEPFVNVGVHQEVWLEVDLDYTLKNKIPVVRRDLGGGTVVITQGEHDYFIVLRQEEAPSDPKALYEKFLTPVVNVLRDYGLNASLRDQDIVVNGRKISGNGAMTHGKAVVIAGNILMRADTQLMSKCIKVPSEKFRDKMAKDMSEWITSLERELGYVPPREELDKKLKQSFEAHLGIKFEDSMLTPEEIERWEQLASEKRNEEWIYYKDRRHPDLRTDRCVKISSAVAICHLDYKARKLVRITAKFVEKRLQEVSISGDFFVMSPRDFIEKLEDRLSGTSPDNIPQMIDKAFSELKPVIFGFNADDLKKAFEEILNKPEVQEVI
ncbi:MULTISPECIES: biotin/lipoate A/B protein ligase family protein [Metallosphaera]|uniref:lipoate--protein ligase family protein n=1 Tax=Metallosphaera TaxID=41980 RepID=UPI001F069916|nr:biotin/lipoate A/B protein ligase family protein [Metallosphaera sedula]MCH1770139.1 lipoate--protein ligase family protein [Metallosphaera sedula]MCP6728027.1 lipoate--protein ligase family protein [Metallosphaera sedula]